MGKTKQESGDCPLTFPTLEVIDHHLRCPVFRDLLTVAADGTGLTSDDIPPLQEEIQILYKCVTTRIDQLIQENDLLTDWLESNKSDRHSERSVTPTEPARMTRALAENPSVRQLRDTPCRSESGSPAPSKVRPKQSKLAAEMESLGRLPKSDAPEKFWAIVEPYCSDITQDDMKVLEELLKTHDDDVDYYKIMSLGKHYSQKWLAEDMEQERKDDMKLASKKKIAGQKRRLDSTGETSSTSTDDNSKPGSTEEEEESPFGPLTQRLVAALIEENVMTPGDDGAIDDGNAVCPEEISQMTPKELAKQLNISNTGNLEKRIRRELEEQGILQPDDVMECEEGDEILVELKQKQQELRALGQHNLTATKRLYRLAKEEMARQDMKRKLAAVDADVLEAYRRVQLARQKKRPPTKREKDTVLRALKERDALVKQIETHII